WQRAEVTQRAAVVATALQRQLEEPLSLLRSIASVYSSSRRTGREGFHALALEALPRLPGVVAVEWIPRVPDALRAAHEEAARSQGLPWYQIQDRDARGHWGRAPQRPGYFPICFVEPVGAQNELGRDLATRRRNSRPWDGPGIFPRRSPAPHSRFW